ncbi:MAG: cytochrome ubiquinol oxidase subunit I [Deltaproteobacteria bacterium]|nr:cytochrome ubiquinol oxidase subunit I [Deltaproteobacteria bacterium]
MDAALLARIQFGFTAGFHFLFPPLTIGMAWIIFYMLSRYRKTNEDVWNKAARFWTKLFVITFAIGVATGITLEFQFGTNWEVYSRFVGDIFGAPLAAEGIFTFFLESAFVGVMIFGWDKVSKGTLWFSSLMVAIGSTLSAFWIIAANSWQQTPVAYHVVNGRAELTNFLEAVFNPSTMPRYLHTVDGALATGAFFMLGISAWYVLKGRHREVAEKSLKVALVVAFAASVLQLPLGHYHAVQVARTQPCKLAAYEGLFETRTNAPVLVFGIPDAKKKRCNYKIEIPGALSWMAFGTTEAEVKGLDAFPEEEWPPLLPTFVSFHTMVGLGTYFIGFTMLGLFLWWRRKLFHSRWFLVLAVISLPGPLIANVLGWMAAEIGRQPWIVQGLLKTRDAVSVVVPAWQILASLLAFVVVYALLFVAWVHMLKRAIAKGPDAVHEAAAGEVSS